MANCSVHFSLVLRSDMLVSRTVLFVNKFPLALQCYFVSLLSIVRFPIYA